MEHLRKNILHLEDVEHGYGDNIVLDNLDLSIQKGSLVTLLGPSGSGKSTLYRLITGEEFVSNKGTVLVDGNPAGFPDPRRGIVYQKYSLFPHKTVLGNVMLPRIWKIPLKDILFKRSWWKEEYKRIEEEAMEYLSKVRLADSAHKMPKDLSGGMRQRVAIVQALMGNHEILLMDEPFGALDKDIRRDLQLYLLELWEEHNMTILFVTHSLQEAAFLGSRLIVLSQHYSDDRGKDYKRGAKIAYDQGLWEYIDKRHDLGYDDYVELLAPIIHEADQSGLNPDYLQHVSKFKLNAPNSFQTLTSVESNGTID